MNVLEVSCFEKIYRVYRKGRFKEKRPRGKGGKRNGEGARGAKKDSGAAICGKMHACMYRIGGERHRDDRLGFEDRIGAGAQPRVQVAHIHAVLLKSAAAGAQPMLVSTIDWNRTRQPVDLHSCHEK